jgi:hypothetical protein
MVPIAEFIACLVLGWEVAPTFLVSEVICAEQEKEPEFEFEVFFSTLQPTIR